MTNWRVESECLRLTYLLHFLQWRLPMPVNCQSIQVLNLLQSQLLICLTRVNVVLPETDIWHVFGLVLLLLS